MQQVHHPCAAGGGLNPAEILSQPLAVERYRGRRQQNSSRHVRLIPMVYIGPGAHPYAIQPFFGKSILNWGAFDFSRPSFARSLMFFCVGVLGFRSRLFFGFTALVAAVGE